MLSEIQAVGKEEKSAVIGVMKAIIIPYETESHVMGTTYRYRLMTIWKRSHPKQMNGVLPAHEPK